MHHRSFLNTAPRITLVTAGALALALGMWGQGCGGDSEDPSPATEGDASTPTNGSDADSEPSADAADASNDGPIVDPNPIAECDPSKPFGAPTPVTELNVAAAQFGARLSTDYLEVVFHASPTATTQLYRATRADRTLPFGKPELIPGLADAGSSGAAQGAYPTLSENRLTIYFESNRGGRVQIWYATRMGVTTPFGEAELVEGLVDATNTGQPYLSGESPSTSIFFVSRHASPDAGPDGTLGGPDVYRANVTGVGVVSNFVHEIALSTTVGDLSPVISDDGLLAFVSRPMFGDGGASPTSRIWSSRRAAKGDAWSPLTPVPELSSGAGNDLVSWISPNGCVVFLASDDTGSGDYKIKSAVRPK